MHTFSFRTLCSELSSSRSLRVDPLVLHTIELLQFIKKMQSLITTTKLQLQDVVTVLRVTRILDTFVFISGYMSH